MLKCAVALVAKCCSESECGSGCMSDCICAERPDSSDGDKGRVNVYCRSMKALVERETISKTFQLSHSRKRKLGAHPGTACVPQKDYLLSSSNLDINHFGLFNNALSVPDTGRH